MTPTIVFMSLYVLTLIGIAIYLIVLATRLVKAQERSAQALVDIARKMKDSLDR
ncbi:hypothetical protein MMG85_12985 [Pseudoxanthomonas sp. LH2527]|uniref:hypothetical protein n=1 Tax=Pseudoxanthomonas sp. LH2527 TaxID=2923249 RepID=UPI001F13AE26|nr:hypothetical protein [Pseudoxanthomonas sp. LH2527]MCH6484470.1 hypothetical protein [Pseudoxanthomonas sp. LH2527]